MAHFFIRVYVPLLYDQHGNERVHWEINRDGRRAMRKSVSGEASLTQHRHRSNLEACAERLGRFQELLDSTEDVTLATHEIQQALRFLGKVTGHVYVEEVLDVIFRDFCIGK